MAKTIQRMWFKIGAAVGLVPPGSIASGMELVTIDRRCKRGWRFVTRDLDKLWRKHETDNRKNKALRKGAMSVYRNYRMCPFTQVSTGSSLTIGGIGGGGVQVASHPVHRQNVQAPHVSVR